MLVLSLDSKFQIFARSASRSPINLGTRRDYWDQQQWSSALPRASRTTLWSSWISRPATKVSSLDSNVQSRGQSLMQRLFLKLSNSPPFRRLMPRSVPDTVSPPHSLLLKVRILLKYLTSPRGRRLLQPGRGCL